MSLSRTGRPLTNRYWPSALARVSEGAAAKPSTTTPSRSARTSIAELRKSVPRISPSLVNRPAAPRSAAAQVTGARSSPASVKATSGRAIARRRTPSRIPSAAVGEDADPARRGVDRVFHQLLDHAGRPLHHFASGDAVDDGFGRLADRHGFKRLVEWRANLGAFAPRGEGASSSLPALRARSP